jgi:hypothetical protein
MHLEHAERVPISKLVSERSITMIFPEDKIRDLRRSDDHSVASIVVVSVAMIAVALVGMSFVIA